MPPTSFARSIRPSCSKASIAASAAAHATGLPPYGAAEAAGVRGVHDLGAAGHGRQGKAARDALGGRDQIGNDAEVLAREHLAGAGEAGLDLVGDEDDVVRAAPVDERRQEAVGGDDEAALALDRLDDDRRRGCRRRPASR